MNIDVTQYKTGTASEIKQQSGNTGDLAYATDTMQMFMYTTRWEAVDASTVKSVPWTYDGESISTTPVLWFDTSDSSTVLNTDGAQANQGDSVSEWKCKVSGNSLVPGSRSESPVLTGGIDFSTSGEIRYQAKHLELKHPTGNRKSQTVIMVFDHFDSRYWPQSSSNMPVGGSNNGYNPYNGWGEGGRYVSHYAPIVSQTLYNTSHNYYVGRMRDAVDFNLYIYNYWGLFYQDTYSNRSQWDAYYGDYRRADAYSKAYSLRYNFHQARHILVSRVDARRASNTAGQEYYNYEMYIGTFDTKLYRALADPVNTTYDDYPYGGPTDRNNLDTYAAIRTRMDVAPENAVPLRISRSGPSTSLANDGLHLGAHRIMGQYQVESPFRIQEVMVFSEALSNTSINKIANKLKTKWNNDPDFPLIAYINR